MQRLVLCHHGEEGMWYKSGPVADFFAHGGEFVGCTFSTIPDTEQPMQCYYKTADGHLTERDQPGAIRHEYSDGERLYVDLPAGHDPETMCKALTAHFRQHGMPSGRAFCTETVEEMRAW
jgi:hypothetical protein